MVSLRTFLALVGLGLSAQLGWATPADFTVRSATGTNVFRLSDAKGKFVALHFLLKTECPICLRHTREYAEKSVGDGRVIQVFLKPDSEEEIKLWTAKLGDASLKVTIYRDPDAALAKAYGIPDGYKFHGQTVYYPAFLLLDGKGQEVFRYVGKSNADRFSYEEFLVKLGQLTEASLR
jgi:peroxiredoxin Q/BCP